MYFLCILFALGDYGWIHSQHTLIVVALFIVFRLKNPILKLPSRGRAEDGTHWNISIGAWFSANSLLLV